LTWILPPSSLPPPELQLCIASAAPATVPAAAAAAALRSCPAREGLRASPISLLGPCNHPCLALSVCLIIGRIQPRLRRAAPASRQQPRERPRGLTVGLRWVYVAAARAKCGLEGRKAWPVARRHPTVGGKHDIWDGTRLVRCHSLVSYRETQPGWGPTSLSSTQPRALNQVVPESAFRRGTGPVSTRFLTPLRCTAQRPRRTAQQPRGHALPWTALRRGACTRYCASRAATLAR
jgi:hypothetical protein